MPDSRLQNSGFFLKISKEIGKAWRMSLKREAREPHTPVRRVRREKKTARTEIFEMMEAVEKMHPSFFVVVALAVVDMSLLH